MITLQSFLISCILGFGCVIVYRDLHLSLPYLAMLIWLAGGIQGAVTGYIRSKRGSGN